MRTGIATVPLDYGRCPKWLFERMRKLAKGILITIAEEFGPEEILKRFSNPVWFQSFGCVLGFDWNSSGLATTTLGAVKSALWGLQDEVGFYICGGKGRTSQKTPEEIKMYGLTRGFDFASGLVYASKMAAKVDSSLIQSGHQIYHHSFLFTKSGKWGVVQQGLNAESQTARRYHWLSSNVSDFVEEPHSGIISDVKVKPLNLTAKESRENKGISTELVKEEPKTFLRDIKLISEKSNSLIKQKRFPGFCEMELKDIEFSHHPVEKEEFDLKRLEKTIFFANEQNPENFEKLLSLKGVGPKTIRALSLVSELIYGARPSYEDPARYSFCVGGKDGTPTPINLPVYNKLLETIEKGIKKSKISNREKIEAQGRLTSFRPSLSCKSSELKEG